MSIKVRTKRPDATLKQIVETLEQYGRQHPRAIIETYRQNSVSVRIRIIDADFAGKTRAEREDELWSVLEKLPEEVVSQISVILLLTPEEARKSFANVEFDNPVSMAL